MSAAKSPEGVYLSLEGCISPPNGACLHACARMRVIGHCVHAHLHERVYVSASGWDSAGVQSDRVRPLARGAPAQQRRRQAQPGHGGPRQYRPWTQRDIVAPNVGVSPFVTPPIIFHFVVVVIPFVQHLCISFRSVSFCHGSFVVCCIL